MPGRKKARVKDLRVSGKYMLASLIVEGLLLAPKTTVRWNGKDLQIGGIIPMLQKEIAEGARDTLDKVLPQAATALEAAVRQTGLKETAMDKILWFVYDYMEQFTLNSIVTNIIERANLPVDPRMTGLFRDYLQEVLDSKDDRDKLISGITDFLMNTMSSVFAGTSVDTLLNGGLRDNVKATISDYVDRGMQTETGYVLTERLLGAVENFETLTLGAFLEKQFDLPRPAFEKYLSDLYEQYLGTDLVARCTNHEISDELYRKISGMDYDAVFKDITKNHWRDLLGVTTTAAGVGVTILNYANKLEAKDQKKAAKKSRKREKKATKKAARKAAKAIKRSK